LSIEKYRVVFFIIETEPPIHMEVLSTEKQINEILSVLGNYYKSVKIDVIKV